MNTDEGKKDRDKIPSDGARRDAFKSWEEEQKNLKLEREKTKKIKISK